MTASLVLHIGCIDCSKDRTRSVENSYTLVVVVTPSRECEFVIAYRVHSLSFRSKAVHKVSRRTCAVRVCLSLIQRQLPLGPVAEDQRKIKYGEVTRASRLDR